MFISALSTTGSPETFLKALKLLRKIEKIYFLDRSVRTEILIKQANIYIKHFSDISSKNKAIKNLNIAYSINDNNPYLKAHCLHLMALNYFPLGKYKLALLSLNRAIELLKPCIINSRKAKNKLCHVYQVKAIYQALLSNRISGEIYQHIENKYGEGKLSVYLKQSISYINKKKFDLAMYSIEEAKSMFNNTLSEDAAENTLRETQMKHLEGTIRFLSAVNSSDISLSFRDLSNALNIAYTHGLHDQIKKINATIDCLTKPKGRSHFWKMLNRYPF